MALKSRKKGIYLLLLTLLVIIIFLLLLFFLYERNRNPAGDKETNTRSTTQALRQLEQLRKRPDFAWPVNHLQHELQLVEHTAFSLGYAEEHEQAAWVAYLLSSRHDENLHNRRNNFRTDPKVLSESASPRDYTNSGYDRGHLAPAADFDFSRKALSESFFMSNMSPQLPSLNRGDWKTLEELIRQWASAEDSLWVITGPVLGEGLKKIGGNSVSVPDYFYKIIFDARQPEIKMISFLLPNKRANQELRYRVVTVDSIEKVSGLDFFPQLPDVLEDSLESLKQTTYWFKKH